MAEKQELCCARRQGQVMRSQNDLRCIARRMSRTPELPKWGPIIKQAKAAIKANEQMLIDHETEHAA